MLIKNSGTEGKNWDSKFFTPEIIKTVKKPVGSFFCMNLFLEWKDENLTTKIGTYGALHYLCNM
jgi:hypothetical protein